MQYHSIFRPGLFAGQTIIVTGGGSGLGRCTAHELRSLGARIALIGRTPEKLEQVKQELDDPDTFTFAADLRREDQVKEAVERVLAWSGRIDGLVNNAGGQFPAQLKDISLNGWNAVIGINVNGVFFGCKWAGKQMMAQGGGGVIINVSSIAGVYGSTMMSHYGASKAAVVNFTRALGMAWGRKGVRVNCIAPGPVETEGYLGVLTKQDPAAAKKAYDTVASRVGMGRWGKVEEIAYPCIFLASAASSFMTGETIVIDGGPAPQLGDG